MKAPGVKDSWEQCDVWTQSRLIAYSQIRGYEESKVQALLEAFLKVKI